MILHYILTWFHTEYLPLHGAFYNGQIWGNVFVAPVAFFLGWLWSKTKFWPLKPVERGLNHLHEKVDTIHGHVKALHDRHDQHDDHLKGLNLKHDKLRETQDHHGILLRAIADHLGLEVPPLPSESHTDQTPKDQH